MEELSSQSSARYQTSGRPVESDQSGRTVQRVEVLVPANAPSVFAEQHTARRTTGTAGLTQLILPSARASRPKVSTNESNAHHVTVFTPPFTEPMGRQSEATCWSSPLCLRSRDVFVHLLSTYHHHAQPIARTAHPLLPRPSPETVHDYSSARDRRRYV